MNMIPVESSNLAEVGYDSSSSTLYVAFHSGGVYAYFNVPERVFHELLDAPSKGQYHARNIKNVYRYQRL